MPNYFYVKDNGTLTVNDDTPYSSIQSSSFATLGTGNYYPNIYTAVTAGSKASPATSGDYILCSDIHSASATFGGGITIPSGVNVISVDDDNGSLYSPGATENDTGTSNDYIVSQSLIAGMSLETGDDVILVSGNRAQIEIRDATLKPDTSTCLGVRMAGSGCHLRMVNVDIAANNALPNAFLISNASFIEWYGGSISTLTEMISSWGESYIYIEGVDLSSITSFADTEPSSATGMAIMVLKNCKLNSGLSFPTAFALQNQRIEIYNSDDVSGNALHRFYVLTWTGTAANNDTTYVTATEAWSYDGSTKSSIEVTTTANCSHSTPFIFELPAQFVDLSSTSSDVLTLDLVTDSTAVSLTDTDIAAFLVYPDGTTPVQANWVTSGKTVGTGNYGIDPLAAGTALSASSLGAGDWTGEPASANFYKMELDTSGAAGGPTVASIRIEVYKASIGSGDLFIHPIMTVA